MERNHSILQNGFIQHLLTFDHATRTDVAHWKLTNKDFLVLCMFTWGPLTCREVRELSSAWRRDPQKLDPYFNQHYGHVSEDERGKKVLHGFYGPISHPPKGPLLWYRVRRHLTREHVARINNTNPRTTYAQLNTHALTEPGCRRAIELLRYARP